MELKLKKDDWCFCEFTLQQVKKTEGNRITQVSDGRFSLWSRDLSDRCYPLEMRVKNISSGIEYWSNKFHAIKNNSLNYPDMNMELIRRWVEMCDKRENEKELKVLYDNLEKFANSVLRKVNDLDTEQVEGVKIFR